MKIGEVNNRVLWSTSDTPACEYVEKRPFGDVPTHKIQSRRYNDKANLNPGPGAYDPILPNVFVHAPHLVMGNERRGHWMVGQKNPSPADYSPNKGLTLPREPSFTIGARSRRNKRRDRHPSPKRTIIGIDVFHISLDPSINENEAREYIKSHPDIKYVLHDVIEEILQKKPLAPVGYLRDYFLDQKRQMGIVDPEPEVDPLEYYRQLANE